ncbi:hypothetical protein THAOC_34569 [Thalassiosira oceanica]|uniref:tRNA-specific adenosine deaminase 1 n=1 Tax=Thalassiosira oceanica TaxID=159749 RepID=K0R2A8_THAOC|nr:hypothetical protein THAOC_34569 [Thalassiosira oceanica]|eukprot:EJK46748.1 hypothetical protein THAOC_34569 [Thalassiosira oceanica]
MLPPFADRVAKCALEHYRALPNGGGKPQASEWTVYASIVAHNSHSGDMWVVSCATGSKCTSLCSVVSSLPADSSECKKVDALSNSSSSSSINDSRQSHKGLVIKDSHAEVLSRRGLVASLWGEIEGNLHEFQAGRRVREDDPRALLECIQSSSAFAPEFRFKKDVITLHMYVSESPCGDATIYEIETTEGKTEVNFTGAKIILSGGEEHQTTNITSLQEEPEGEVKVRLGREQVQIVKKLRVKSSRSNIPNKMRSMSLCCADKIVRWSVFGLQGALLSKFLIEPITLTSICVSRDPRSVDGGQLAALNRSLVERIDETLRAQKSKSHNRSLNALNVFIVDAFFESSKTSHEEKKAIARKRKIGLISKTKCDTDKPKRKAACGMSLNWHRGSASVVEITVGATGLKRGKKAKKLHDVPPLSSRLCRFNLCQTFVRCSDIVAALSNDKWHTDGNRGYLCLKRRHGSYIDDSSFCGPLLNWIRSGKEDDFEISITRG